MKRRQLKENHLSITSKKDPVLRLHHFAWRCKNAEETRAFYEDILGMPLAHIIRADVVPSTGEYCPYVHLFFKMEDNSYIAFFDLGDDLKAQPSPNTPAWVNHFAMKLASVEALARFKVRLEQAGVDVLGVTDHGSMQSIYFFDPSGHRLELAADTATPDMMKKLDDVKWDMLEEWNKTKRAPKHAAWMHEKEFNA